MITPIVIKEVKTITPIVINGLKYIGKSKSIFICYVCKKILKKITILVYGTSIVGWSTASVVF